MIDELQIMPACGVQPAGEGSPQFANDAETAASLRAHGLRSTRARRVILGVLGHQNDHPTVEEISRRLTEQRSPVSLPTLYQNLHRLVEARLLQSFLDSDGRLRFDANLTPHHHLRCLGCGMIMDVKAEETLEEVIAHVCGTLGPAMGEWTIEDARVELQGCCPRCRACLVEGT